MPDTTTIRTFVAVRIPGFDSLKRILEELHEIGRPVRAVSAEHLHLTLKFLGDVDRERTAEIANTLNGVCSRHAPFQLSLVGIGAFPHAERPSVIWVGMSDSRPLIELAGDIESACTELGCTPEQRPFQPHLTLARLRRHRGRKNVQIPSALGKIMQTCEQTEFGTADVDRVVLFRSQLGPDGPRYSELSTAKLRTG